MMAVRAPKPRRGVRGAYALTWFVLACIVALTASRRQVSFIPPPAGASSSRTALRSSPIEDRTAVPRVADLETDLPSDGTANLEETKFWDLVDQGKISEVVILSWDNKEVLVKLEDGSRAALREDSEVEDLRDKLIKSGVATRYPQVDELSVDEALEKAEYTSEGAVAGGVLAALLVGIADSAIELGGAVAISGLELGGQSLLEKKSPADVANEDLGLLGKDLRIVERVAERTEEAAVADLREAGGLLEGQLESVRQWFEDVAHGIAANHAEGLGGIIEDSFDMLLVGVSLYSLYQMAFLRRKSNSWSGLAHTATGAMQIVTVVYAILEERCLRESPGTVWAVFTFAIFMVNNITMWPLLKYFKGTEVQRVLFKLAYSFIISFQGIHAIAWSIAYPWLYWVVMPFWFYSVKKLFESSDNIFALLPEGTVPIPGLQEAARRRVKGIQNDVPTIVYSALNFAGAVFDNLYMAVYTWRGPAGFWGWSAANIPAVNDHLRTALVKPAFGSLTISVLVFLGTLVYRKKISVNTALALNVVLASIGPWLILYYHKLIDWDEPWQPEIAGDWGNLPYFMEHGSDLAALAVMPLALLGLKTAGFGAVAPAVADVIPDGLAQSLPETSLSSASAADLGRGVIQTDPAQPP